MADTEDARTLLRNASERIDRLLREVERLREEVRRVGDRVLASPLKYADPQYDRPPELYWPRVVERLDIATRGVRNAEYDIAAIRAAIEGRLTGVALRDDLAQAVVESKTRITTGPQTRR